MRIRHIIGMATMLVAACGSPPPADSFDEAAVKSAVAARVRAYAAVLSPARCKDPEPYYDFWTYDRDGVVLAENGRISQLDPQAHRTPTQAWFCGVASQSVAVDTVVVQVLGEQAAIATWTFSEVVVDTSGVRSQIRGDVMQPWVWLGGAWRSTGLVATHEVTTTPAK